MRHAWFAMILLISGCAVYPVNNDGTAWNPNGINYGDPNAAPIYGSYSSYPGYWWPTGSLFYPGYSSFGYPCGSYLGCGAPVPLTPVVGTSLPAAAGAIAYAARPVNIARARTGLSLRFGGRHRGRR